MRHSVVAPALRDRGFRAGVRSGVGGGFVAAHGATGLRFWVPLIVHIMHQIRAINPSDFVL